MSYRDYRHYYDRYSFDMMDDHVLPYEYSSALYTPYSPDYFPAFDETPLYYPLNRRLAKKPVKNSHLYKTELCSQWLAKGHCPYNHRCRFAHGPQELRPITRGANYRSKPCRKFKAQGWCPYGARCTFIHDPRDVQTAVKEDFICKEADLKDDKVEDPLEENNANLENTLSGKPVSAKVEMTRKLQEKDRSDPDSLTRTFAELGLNFKNMNA
jgi:hypothetical protein